MSPFKKVPFVNTPVLPMISIPRLVRTPVIVPLETIRPHTKSCHVSKLDVCSNISHHVIAHNILSVYVRGIHVSGPFDLFSILN